MAGIKLTVGGDASKAYSVLDGVGAKAASVADRISKGFQERIGHRMFDGLMRAARSLPNAMKEAIDAGGRLSDQMARTGAAGEGLVILERALQNAGIGAEKTVMLLGMMQRSFAGMNEDMQTTSEAFARLGMSMEELRGMDPTDAFQAIGKSIMSIADPAERTALAMRIFGRSGAEALVAFSDPDGIARATAELGELPAVLTENAARLDMVSDRLATMGTGWKQIGTAAASAVLPAMERITAQIASMDLTGIGRQIGRVLNVIAALAPALGTIGAAMIALKITSFIGALANKTRAWWAETAAIKANSAALAQNAAAGRGAAAGKAAGGIGRGGMLAAGGAMAAGLVVQQLMISYAERLREANDALTESINASNSAMQKFGIQGIRAQMSTREEIEATVAAIHAEKDAIWAAANARIDSAPNGKIAARIQEETEITISLLDATINATRKMTDEQLAANAATKAAAEAEGARAEAVEKAAEAYEKLRKNFAEKLEFADEAIQSGGTLAEQLAEIDRAAGAVREKMSGGFGFQWMDSDEILKTLDGLSDIDGPEKTQDLEQAIKLRDIEAKRAALTAQIAASREDAGRQYQEDLAILTAMIAGEDAKVAALQREADIRAEIVRLTAAGATAEEATGAATRLVDARLAAEAAEAATAAEERRNEARQRGADIMADAAAVAQGADAAATRAIEKRAQEIADQSGLGIDEARGMAANEAGLDELTRLRGQSDGMQMQSTLGAVSDMQRIGGGGAVVSSGIDIARQQADLQRQMVTLLGQILARSPESPISDF